MQAEYKVIKDNYLPDLERTVSAYINKGWSLHECLIVTATASTSIIYHQVVVKRMVVVR